MEKGTVFNIQKFSINDGPGIRTTVFLKGCPLNCAWCHNPESKSVHTDLFYDEKKCIFCGKCADVCPMGCHSFEDGKHLFDRTDCTRCGLCAEHCAPDALEKVGYTATVDEVIEEVMRDEAFYRNSGGGMTLSGGEPMMQPEFTYALLTAAKEKGLHTCIETCGFAPWEDYEKIIGMTDIFLFDYKLSDTLQHRKYTGVTNELILQNLERLDAAGADIILRCPVIPTVNDTPEHFSAVAFLAERLKNIREINVEPYHPLGSNKSAMLNKEYPLSNLTFPENSAVEAWINTIRAQTTVPVKKA